MDFHTQMILDQYKEKKGTYELIGKIVTDYLQDFVSESNLMVSGIESRVKTYESLEGKLDLKGHKYIDLFDITDILGARIITFYADDVDKIAAKVETSFSIDWENTIDKRKMHDIDSFGYMSLHYICRIPKELYYDSNNEILNEIRFEIQIRSILQHTWAAIQHDTGYKTDVEIPKEYLRAFNRLAGLLEIADEEFCHLRNSIQEYRRRIGLVVKNGKLDEIELNGDSYSVYVKNGGFDMLNKRIATISNMEIEDVSLDNFLKVFKSLGFNTLKELDDLVINYSDLAYEFAVRQFNGKDIDIMSSITGPLSLSVVYVISMGMGTLVIKLILDRIFGARKTNEKQAEKLYNLGLSMGLIKN